MIRTKHPKFLNIVISQQVYSLRVINIISLLAIILACNM